jgi:hypothetical protein
MSTIQISAAFQGFDDQRMSSLICFANAPWVAQGADSMMTNVTIQTRWSMSITANERVNGVNLSIVGDPTSWINSPLTYEKGVLSETPAQGVGETAHERVVINMSNHTCVDFR